MVVDRKAVGAMNLYAHDERAFDEAAIETGKVFAAQAAAVLLNTHAYWDARDLGDRLGEAMEHRAVIERAKGMLMATEGCDDEEAFQILVRASQRENVKLRDIAARMVEAANRRAAARRSH
jgi:hypothetical protein